MIYLGTLLAVGVVAALLQFPAQVAGVQVGMLVLWLGWFTWYVIARCDRIERGRMVSILFFIFFVLLFFALYEQTYASWVTFTDRLLDKDLFPSLVLRDGKHLPWSILPLVASPFVVAWSLRQRNARASQLAMGLLTVFGFALIARDSVVLPQTAGSLTYLGSLFIVLLSPIFSWLWPALARKGLNPDKAVKCVIGLALAGVSYYPLLWASQSVGSGQAGSVWWLALAYLVLEVAEVTLSPITLAAISELSVRKVLAVMMSSWLLATSFAETLAARLSSLASLEIKPGDHLDMAAAAAKYSDLFQSMVWVGLGSAVVALACIPLLRRWMHGLH
jgi:POT family proton-dependent oligopeptide transporter